MEFPENDHGITPLLGVPVQFPVAQVHMVTVPIDRCPYGWYRFHIAEDMGR